MTTHTDHSQQAEPLTSNPGYQAFWALRLGFTALPILFGIDKFANVLTNDWTKYLATCLLYTSPSPRDGLLSRMPSSA